MGRIVHFVVAILLTAAVISTVAAAGRGGGLADAINSGDIAAVRALIKSGADVNQRSGDGSTALLWAAHTSHVEIARALIAAKAAVDTPNDFGVTPLLEASRNGDSPMVHLLLRSGADPKRTHPEGETPLLSAARAGSVAAVRLLLARGANINVKNGDDASAAMVAIYNDRFDVAAALIELGSDVKDGSLYVAAEMRDATTDQFVRRVASPARQSQHQNGSRPHADAAGARC
jgi:uncharacterized protein